MIPNSTDNTGNIDHSNFGKIPDGSSIKAKNTSKKKKKQKPLPRPENPQKETSLAASMQLPLIAKTSQSVVSKQSLNLTVKRFIGAFQDKFSFGNRLLGFTGGRVMDAFQNVQGYATQPKKAIYRTVEAFVVKDFAEDAKQQKKLLKQMTGDEHSSALLHSLAGYLAKNLSESETVQNMLSLISEAIESEVLFLQQLMEYICLKAVVNIGKELKKEGKEVSMFAIVSRLIMEMGDRIKESQEAYAEALAISDPVQRENALNRVSLSIVNPLLDLILPKGAEELPLRKPLRGKIWLSLIDLLKSQIAPFQRLAHQIAIQSPLAGEVVQKELVHQGIAQARSLLDTQGHTLFANAENAKNMAESILSTWNPGKSQDASLLLWLSNQIQELGGGKEEATRKELWNWLTPKMESLISFIFSQLSQKGNAEQPVPTIVLHLIKEVGGFDRKHGLSIEACVRKLKAEGKDPLSPEYLNLFKPLLASLQDASGLSSLTPILREAIGLTAVDKLETLLLSVLANAYETYVVPLPLPLSECYWMIEKGIRPQDDNLLFKPLNDRAVKAKSDLERLLTMKREGGAFCSSEKAGEIVGQIEKGCAIFANKQVPLIQEQIDLIIQKKLGGVPDQLQGMAVQDFRQRYVHKFITVIFLQMLTHYLHANPLPVEAGEEIILADHVISKVLEKLGRILEHHFYEPGTTAERARNTIKMYALREQLNPKQNIEEEKAKALRAVFEDLAKDLIKAVTPEGSNPEQFQFDVPFKPLLENLWTWISNELLPDLLVDHYMDITIWSHAAETSLKIIQEESETHYIPEGCRVLGEWLGELIPSYLYRNQEELSLGIYRGIASYLVKEGTEGMSVNDYIQQNEMLLKKRLCEDLFSCCAPDGRLVSITNPVTSKAMEAALLKIARNLTVNINRVQGKEPKEQEKFMVNFGLNALKIFNAHFGPLNEVTRSSKIYAAHLVPHETFVKGFGDKLHKGVPQSQEGLKARRKIKRNLAKLEAERRQYDKLSGIAKEKSRKKIKKAQAAIRTAKEIEWKERSAFFKPLSEKFIKLMGLNGPEDLAVPAELRPQLWELFTQQFVPTVLSNIFETISHPDTRMKMMMSGLTNLNLAMDGISDAESAEERLAADDEMQRNLNKACGELVLQLIQLVPHSMIQAVFKIDKLKILERQSAELVGKAVRDYLGRDLNILKWIDLGVQSGLPALFPGKWEIDKGQRFVRDPNAPWPFPLNDDEIEQQERHAIARSDADAKVMRKMMVDTTRRITSEKMMNWFKLPLLKLELIWNWCVRKVFRGYADGVLNFFKVLGKNTVFKLIEAGLSALSYPPRAAFWFFMEWHIGRRADHVIKSLQLDIHENLLCHLIDHLIDSLSGELKPEEPEKVIEPYLEQAQERSVKEIDEVKDLIARLKGWGLSLAHSK